MMHMHKCILFFTIYIQMLVEMELLHIKLQRKKLVWFGHNYQN